MLWVNKIKIMLLYILIAWNIFIFLLYGYDKLMAIKNGWRVSEKTLLMSAFLFGGIGAYFGMIIFKHKTRHKNFKFLLPLFCGLTIGLFYGLNYFI